MKTLSRAILATGLALCGSTALAGEGDGSWNHTVHLYGMGAAIEGDAQIGPLALPVDVSISELFDALRMGGMAAYRADNGTWSFTGDVTYMDLGWRASTAADRAGGELRVDQLTVMATVGRRISPHVEVLASAAYFDVDTALEVRVLQQSRRATRQASWVDPLVGMQYSVPVGDKWTYTLRGDVGGFGVGSKFTWHVATVMRRQVTDTFDWYVGYRVIAYDYSEGSGVDRMHYDMTQHGPGVGVAFSF
jgi:hypothetical protein